MANISGYTIQHDNSGVGHNWRTVDLPPDVAEEIAAEIIDGGNESHGDYVATNGLHYRWFPVVEDETAQTVGQRIGQAIARDTIADRLPARWAGLWSDDGDQIPDRIDLAEVEIHAKAAYEAAIREAGYVEPAESDEPDWRDSDSDQL